MTREEFRDYVDFLRSQDEISYDVYSGLIDGIDTLEQEPCDDEYIKVPKKALKYRTAGMVAYNAEWLKNHFDIERAVICGAQEPCEVEATKLQAYNKGYEDCRQAVLDTVFECIDAYDSGEVKESLNMYIQSHIKAIPSAQPKTRHWIIKSETSAVCSRCHKNNLFYGDFCKWCGTRMVEPKEESEVRV